MGVVAANERGLAQITTRFAGWIQKLLVSETGERVRRGQVLATIYSPDVLRAEQELLVARGWNAGGDGEAGARRRPRSDGLAAGLVANARRRLELLGISAQEIDEILRTGKAVEAIAIRSPVDGYVVGKNAVAGVAVQPGTALFEVADLSQVWVTAEVYEQDISRIRVGQAARLELAAFPGESHAGKVQFIYPVLDREQPNAARAARVPEPRRPQRAAPAARHVRHRLPRPAGRRPGWWCPPEAVVDTGETQYLFVAKDGGHFEPRLVKVGAHAKDHVEILSGVSEGETVVTTGNFLIDSESRLRAAIEGQTSARARQRAAERARVRLRRRLRRAEVPGQVPGVPRLRGAAPRDGNDGRGLQEGDPEAVEVRRPPWSRKSSSSARATACWSCSASASRWSASLVSIKQMKLDAIPDLSDPQVIVFTEWMGRSPTLVEDQVTYPIVSKLIGTPHVTDVRGFSMFGMSFVYVVFEEGTDVYWARSRVLEYMNGLRGALPEGVTPDARPRRDRHRLGVPVRARSTRPASTASTSCARSRTSRCATRSGSVPGVAEVASVGGYQKQYQVTVDPEPPARLRRDAGRGRPTPSASRTTTSAAASSRCPGASTTCAGAATSTTSARSRRSRVRASGPSGTPLLVKDVAHGALRPRHPARPARVERRGRGGRRRSWSCATARTRSTSSSA